MYDIVADDIGLREVVVVVFVAGNRVFVELRLHFDVVVFAFEKIIHRQKLKQWKVRRVFDWLRGGVYIPYYIQVQNG